MDASQCNVKFAVFTDLHFDIMHDSLNRISDLIRTACQKNVDFIISLGDLMYPDHEFLSKYSENPNENDRVFHSERDGERRKLLKMLAGCGIPVFYVLGNHEMDRCEKEAAAKYYGCPHPYYSFDAGNTHFVVLDTNFILSHDEVVPYECANYHYYNDYQHPYIPHEQLRWLESDILGSRFPSVIFSHHSVSDSLLAIKNRPDIRALFLRLTRFGKPPILCMNGHSHIDGLSYLAGVPCMDLNSISNIWLGKNFICSRYTEDINQKFPYIKFTAPYRDALFAIVTIQNNQIKVEGRKSEFVGPSPYELGFPKCSSEFLSTPQITSHILQLHNMDGRS